VARQSQPRQVPPSEVGLKAVTPGPSPTLTRITAIFGGIGLGWIILTATAEPAVMVAGLIGVEFLMLVLFLLSFVPPGTMSGHGPSITRILDAILVCFPVGIAGIAFVSLTFVGIPLLESVFVVGALGFVIIVTLWWIRRHRVGPS